MNRVNKLKVHREGTGFLITVFTIMLFVNSAFFYFEINKVLFYSLLVISIFLFLILLNFFRSPHRHFPCDAEGLVIAPADGTIVAIEEVEENEYFHDKRLQVSIFMSVFNVHANWFPVNGIVTHVSYRCGRFKSAYLPKSSLENERSTIVIQTPSGMEVLTRQIAGALARRIVTYAKKQDVCHVDEQMGFIKFGSRVDTFIPVNTEILVQLRQKVTGNQTPIARFEK